MDNSFSAGAVRGYLVLCAGIVMWYRGDVQATSPNMWSETDKPNIRLHLARARNWSVGLHAP